MFRKALEVDPNFGLPLNHIGYALLSLKQYEQAVDAFKEYATVRPGDANALDSLADAYFQMGRLDDAVGAYEKALQVDSSFFGSILAIGYICALREDYFQASEWIDKAVSLAVGRDKPFAYLWKALYFAWLGNYEKSFSNIQMAADLSDALKYELGKAVAERLRAWAYFDKGDFELSRKYNENWLALLIQNVYTYEPFHFKESYHTVGRDFLSGLIDLEEGKIESAKSRLAGMNSLTPDIRPWVFLSSAKDTVEFETEWLRGVLLLYEKSFERAVIYLQKSGVTNFVPCWGSPPDIEKFRYNTPFQRDALARAYVEHGEIDKAISEYERLITFDPTKPARLLIHPLYHYRLGILYEKKGLKDKAKSQYERFLDLWKDADQDRSEPADARLRTK